MSRSNQPTCVVVELSQSIVWCDGVVRLVLMSQSSRLELFVCYFYAICTLFFFLYNGQHSCLGSFRKKLVRNWHGFIIGNMWLMFTFIFCPACPGASIFLFCFFFLMIFLQYSIKKLQQLTHYQFQILLFFYFKSDQDVTSRS